MAKFVEGFAAKLVVPGSVKEVQVFDDALPGFGIANLPPAAYISSNSTWANNSAARASAVS